MFVSLMCLQCKRPMKTPNKLLQKARKADGKWESVLRAEKKPTTKKPHQT